MRVSRREFMVVAAEAASVFIFCRKLTPPIDNIENTVEPKVVPEVVPETELLIPTYLGNYKRRFYGKGTPKKLDLIQRFNLGKGNTVVSGEPKEWSGAGWTGQPTVVKDQGKTFLVIGGFDHQLRKIDINTNEVAWTYRFDDVIKGTATIYIDDTASEENRIVILQGSRRGLDNTIHTPIVPSFRAVSFRTGKELWRLNIRKTDSYSRDNDSSPIFLKDMNMIFNAGENGIGYFLNGSINSAKKKDGIIQPEIVNEVKLYEQSDIPLHGGNLVTESSPARLKDKLYIAAGSGHIYGIDLNTMQKIWDFPIQSDLDGTIPISNEGKLFCSIEKQYLPGNGGVLKLDPDKEPEKSVEWFLPTGDREFSVWQGGVIGSVALNDEYIDDDLPHLFAVMGIDDYLYVGSQLETTGEKVEGPHNKNYYKCPKVIFCKNIGPSISTPIFTEGNKLVAATYNGVYLFKINFERTDNPNKYSLSGANGEKYNIFVEQESHFNKVLPFESTPVVLDGLVRICCKDGFMYTLG
ncbi:hypothetical protein AMJ80_05710 [bacterium SM23_31]|nr:MAG: hypothetical protein AMJ80_05710 [bacterium SM23_31]